MARHDSWQKKPNKTDINRRFRRAQRKRHQGTKTTRMKAKNWETNLTFLPRTQGGPPERQRPIFCRLQGTAKGGKNKVGPEEQAIAPSFDNWDIFRPNPSRPRKVAHECGGGMTPHTPWPFRLCLKPEVAGLQDSEPKVSPVMEGAQRPEETKGTPPSGEHAIQNFRL